MQEAGDNIAIIPLLNFIVSLYDKSILNYVYYCPKLWIEIPKQNKNNNF